VKPNSLLFVYTQTSFMSKVQSLFTNSNQLTYIAGPCSAESPEQLFEVAKRLKALHIPIMRAGIWKPRTRPGSFEGLGVEALPWLLDVKKMVEIKTAVEVAKPSHVEEALQHDVDVLWIGARTTANPFATQELADSLKGVQVPVLVKNPTNPDTSLWLGAIERVEKAGVSEIGAIHRGVSQFKKTKFRNNPQWDMALNLKKERPNMSILCDPSHIAGRAHLVPFVAQHALELKFDGLMVEIHPDPKIALSDAEQQLNLDAFEDMMNWLKIKMQIVDAEKFPTIIEARKKIASIDNSVLSLLAERFKLTQQIAGIKKTEGISIYQEEHWNNIIKQLLKQGKSLGLDENFILKLFESVHLESIDKQIEIIYGQAKP